MIQFERPRSRLGDRHILAQLDAVEQQLRECATQGPGQLPAVHEQLVSPHSKRLRPALLLCAARYGPNTAQPNLVRAAAAIELLHQATLYHDDIVDEAPTRRGARTVYGKYGSVVAAFAGSELLYATVELFADLPPKLRRAVGRTGDQLCRGQLRELETLADVGLSIHERVRIMRWKTASLFELAARIGAELAGGDIEVVRRLARFGLLYGLCFQLADDLRDLAATTSELGRAPGADLKDGVYTLPILFALRSPGRTEALRDCLRQLSHNPDQRLLKQTKEMIASVGGIASSMKVLHGWITQARTLADRLQPDSGPAALLGSLLDPFEGARYENADRSGGNETVDAPLDGHESIGVLGDLP